MVYLPQLSVLFKQSLIDAVARRGGASSYWIGVVHRDVTILDGTRYPDDGILIVVAPECDIVRRKFIGMREIQSSIIRGMRWRRRLFGGPSHWHIHPLWKRRDTGALNNLMIDGIKQVCSA